MTTNKHAKTISSLESKAQGRFLAPISFLKFVMAVARLLIFGIFAVCSEGFKVTNIPFLGARGGSILQYPAGAGLRASTER